MKKSRERELRGLELQEELVKSNNGHHYFVPVTEKIFENDQFIAHVEPKGVPLRTYIRQNGLPMKGKFHCLTQMITALQTMQLSR